MVLSLGFHGAAHADSTELLQWLKSGGKRPDRVCLTHGEPQATFAFSDHITRELGWKVEVPSLGHRVTLV